MTVQDLLNNYEISDCRPTLREMSVVSPLLGVIVLQVGFLKYIIFSITTY